MIPLFKVFMADEAITSVSETLRSGYIAQGPKSDRFEEELQKFFHHPYIATVNSGSSAIHLALYIAKHYFKLQDYGIEVITTPLTCFASNAPIWLNDLHIKWADVEKGGVNIDLECVRRIMTKRTRILLLVHWGGIPVNYNHLESVKNEYYEKYGQELIVIEDCAHAWGATYGGEMLGKGNIGCYSCQAIKTLTTGDGGVLLLPNRELNRLARSLRWFGLDRDNKEDFRSSQNIPVVGWKFHMNDIAASIGLANLPHVNDLVEKARNVASNYHNSINNPLITQIQAPAHSNSSYWLYTILVDDRERFTKYMGDNGIQTHFVHARNDKHTCFEQYRVNLPNLDEVEKKITCIPCGWWVDNEKDMKHIIKVTNEYALND